MVFGYTISSSSSYRSRRIWSMPSTFHHPSFTAKSEREWESVYFIRMRFGRIFRTRSCRIWMQFEPGFLIIWHFCHKNWESDHLSQRLISQYLSLWVNSNYSELFWKRKKYYNHAQVVLWTFFIILCLEYVKIWHFDSDNLTNYLFVYQKFPCYAETWIETSLETISR